jgi:glycerol-3-phosphate acyltransferase PlsY
MGVDLFYQIIIGLLAVVGHNWPVFLGFKGGRGIATSLGVVLAVSPWLGLIMIVLAYGMAPFKQLALGVLIAVSSLPALAWFAASSMGISDKHGALWGFLVMLGLVIFRRLSPQRSEISHDTPVWMLLVNRLLFDRDIRDREAWISRSG